MKYIFLLLISFTVVVGCVPNLKENSIFMLPKEYRGTVIVIFDMEGGSKEEYINNERVYRIPQNGILETKFKSDKGYGLMPRFYISKSDGVLSEAKEIPYIFGEKWKDTIYNGQVVVSSMEFGKTVSNSYMTFIISDFNNYDLDPSYRKVFECFREK